MTVALALGLTRTAAARFSFLLSLPAILLAGAAKGVELVTSPEPVYWSTMFWGAVLAGITTFFCIHLFLKLLTRIGMLPFVIYRLILGAVLVVYFS